MLSNSLSESEPDISGGNRNVPDDAELVGDGNESCRDRVAA
jgi:hypothetical protein